MEAARRHCNSPVVEGGTGEEGEVIGELAPEPAKGERQTVAGTAILKMKFFFGMNSKPTNQAQGGRHLKMEQVVTVQQEDRHMGQVVQLGSTFAMQFTHFICAYPNGD